jgi:hypothetical protein
MCLALLLLQRHLHFWYVQLMSRRYCIKVNFQAAALLGFVCSWNTHVNHLSIAVLSVDIEKGFAT